MTATVCKVPFMRSCCARAVRPGALSDDVLVRMAGCVRQLLPHLSLGVRQLLPHLSVRVRQLLPHLVYCPRSLDHEYTCFNPKGLKYRYYFHDWDRGHRYILNLREGEVYTRHYRRMDVDSPNGCGAVFTVTLPTGDAC